MTVVHKTALPLDVIVLQQSVLPLGVTVHCTTAACAASGRGCTTAACAPPSLDVTALQQPALPMDCLVAGAVPSGDCPKMYGRQGFFHFVSKQICLFRLFRYRFETPKQTETNRKSYF
jgi:hypothetical protein